MISGIFARKGDRSTLWQLASQCPATSNNRRLQISVLALTSLAIMACGGRADNQDVTSVDALQTIAYWQDEIVITKDEGPEIGPVHYILIETWDGLYTPIALRKPEGDGPFPIVLFGSGNGGGGLDYLEWVTRNMSWTQDQYLEAGYAVAWMRYRAEVELGYNNNEEFVEDIRQGRKLLNRSPLEFEDEIAIIEYVKKLPFVNPSQVGHVGLSHAGEMAMKITSVYHGLAAAVANEPASHEFLALSPDETAFVNPETNLRDIEGMQMRETEKVRARINTQLAQRRVSSIQTPILVMGRDDDHLQGIFRSTYDMLDEAGKTAEWVTYDHPEHGYIYVSRNDSDGEYHPDDVQIESVNRTIEFFDKYMR